MNVSSLVKLSEVTYVSCPLKVCNYVKDGSNKLFDDWELEDIAKQDKEVADNLIWPTFGDVKESVAPEGGAETWEDDFWEEDIVLDSADAYPHLNLIETLENRIIENPYSNRKLRYRKFKRKKTILDFYPVEEEQVDFDITDERLFPAEFSNHIDLINVDKTYNFHNGEALFMSGILEPESLMNSAKCGRLFLFESSEQHPSYRMQPCLRSIVVAYGNKNEKIDSKIGIHREILRKSPFLGCIPSEKTYHLTLENSFFRTPLYEHKVPSTDFLMIFSDKKLFVRKIDDLFLGGKQMPLQQIPHPTSDFIRNYLLNFIKHKFSQSTYLSVDYLTSILNPFTFLNLLNDLKKIAAFDINSNQWRLKVSPLDFTGLRSYTFCDYMQFAAVASYLHSYEYIEGDDKQKKPTKKKQNVEKKNGCSPWSVSKAYLRGLYKGFWKLQHFENPTGINQMKSYSFTTSLVHKHSIDKADLRKLTLHQARRLIEKISRLNVKEGTSRWQMVQKLSAICAVEGTDEHKKYARDNKSNNKQLKEKYNEQCNRVFENIVKILSNPLEPALKDESDGGVVSDSKNVSTHEGIEQWSKVPLKMMDRIYYSPCKSTANNIKNLLENPMKKLIIYRVKNGQVEKDIYSVKEIVLEYLRHVKQGAKYVKKLYGIVDIVKQQKLQNKDDESQTKASQKRLQEKNLSNDLPAQVAKNKVCSSCGNKGHIRSNRECPNFSSYIHALKSHGKATGASQSRYKSKFHLNSTKLLHRKHGRSSLSSEAKLKLREKSVFKTINEISDVSFHQANQINSELKISGDKPVFRKHTSIKRNRKKKSPNNSEFQTSKIFRTQSPPFIACIDPSGEPVKGYDYEASLMSQKKRHDYDDVDEKFTIDLQTGTSANNLNDGFGDSDDDFIIHIPQKIWEINGSENTENIQTNDTLPNNIDDDDDDADDEEFIITFPLRNCM